MGDRASAPEDMIDLPDAPAIPGVVYRRFRGEADFPAIVAVMEGSKDADRLEFAVSVEDIEREFRHLENCDPRRDFLLVEAGGKAIGFTQLWWAKDLSGAYAYSQSAYLLPPWRGTGIRNAMLRHNERRLRDIAASHPSGAPRFFQSFIEETEKDWISVLESEGYTVYRYGLRLVRPDLENIPDARLPEGVEVRPVRPEHYRAIVDAWNEACKDMRSQVPLSDETFKEWRESPVFNPSIWRIAWHGDEVIGTVMNFIDAEDNKRYGRLRGHPEMISVKRGWRRRGIATALIADSLRMLKERGMTEAALGVDAENPSGARRLYERLGFKVVKRAICYRKPLDCATAGSEGRPTAKSP